MNPISMAASTAGGELEQHGRGDGIGIVGLHVGIKVLFLFLGIFAVRYFHQDIGEVRFWGPTEVEAR